MKNNCKILLFILVVLTQSCNQNVVKSDYISDELRRFDLRGQVKALQVSTGFEEPNEYYQYLCNGKLSNITDNKFTSIEFSRDGKINKRVSNYAKFVYNNEGELIRKSFINNKGAEYGFSDLTYYHSRYYDTISNYSSQHKTSSSKNGGSKIDTIKFYPDTSIVVERGTRDKFYKGGDGFSVVIYREYVMNSKGYIIEEHGPDVQYSNFHYSYNSDGRLTNKTEYYQGFFMDSINFKYINQNEIINCENKFIYKHHDKYGNWTLLKISDNESTIKIVRNIEYYD